MFTNNFFLYYQIRISVELNKELLKTVLSRAIGGSGAAWCSELKNLCRVTIWHHPQLIDLLPAQLLPVLIILDLICIFNGCQAFILLVTGHCLLCCWIPTTLVLALLFFYYSDINKHCFILVLRLLWMICSPFFFLNIEYIINSYGRIQPIQLLNSKFVLINWIET